MVTTEKPTQRVYIHKSNGSRELIKFKILTTPYRYTLGAYKQDKTVIGYSIEDGPMIPLTEKSSAPLIEKEMDKTNAPAPPFHLKLHKNKKDERGHTITNSRMKNLLNHFEYEESDVKEEGKVQIILSDGNFLTIKNNRGRWFVGVQENGDPDHFPRDNAVLDIIGVKILSSKPLF